MVWWMFVALDGTLGSLGYTSLSTSFKFISQDQLWEESETAHWYTWAQTPASLRRSSNSNRHWSCNAYLGITPPDANWYMNTGATSHMTSSYDGIMVGNGQSFSIHGYGDTKLSSPCPPLQLNYVLHAPHLIKNFVLVRKFTTDNSVYLCWIWSFWVSMKDFQTGRPVMR